MLAPISQKLCTKCHSVVDITCASYLGGPTSILAEHHVVMSEIICGFHQFH
jgi:hypothetical protein